MIDVDRAATGLERLIPRDAQLERLHDGMSFGEGPVWNRRDGSFWWVDIVGDTIWRRPRGGGAEVFMRPSTHANGLTFDREGRLLVAGWASRSVWRVESRGSVHTLASQFGGVKINSPNDIGVQSNGAIWFTDSPGALYNPMEADDLQQYSTSRACSGSGRKARSLRRSATRRIPTGPLTQTSRRCTQDSHSVRSAFTTRARNAGDAFFQSSKAASPASPTA